MSIISTLEQEEPILVTAKELRRIVAIENDRDYYEFLKDANNILIETAKHGRLAGEFSMPSQFIDKFAEELRNNGFKVTIMGQEQIRIDWRSEDND
jgi:hypothetical protein